MRRTAAENDATEASPLVDEACRRHALAVEARARGDARGAHADASAALVLMRRAVGPRHPDTANVLLELARAERELGRLARAERLARRSLETVSAFARLRIPEIARIRVQAMATLAGILVTRGAWREARSLYARGRRAAARLGSNDPDLIAMLNDRAVLYKFEGRLDDAARLYAQAIAASRTRVRDDETEANLLHNLAGLEHARGRYGRAALLARRGLARRARAVGRAHPAYAADLAGYAAMLAGLERWRQAKPLYARAIRLLERTVGPHHPEIAHALANLAAACEATGDHAASEKHYTRSLEVARRTLGPIHLDVALTLHNMSVLARKMGDASRAARLHRRALRVALAAVGARHPRYIEIARAGRRPAAP